MLLTIEVIRKGDSNQTQYPFSMNIVVNEEQARLVLLQLIDQFGVPKIEKELNWYKTNLVPDWEDFIDKNLK